VQVETLLLKHNRLTGLESLNVGHLESLTTLCVSHNQITALPDALCELPGLTSLDAQVNDLTFSGADGIWLCLKLKVLNLYGNKLELLSEGVGDLLVLEQLMVGWNGLMRIPDSVVNLKKLQVCGHNRAHAAPQR